MFIELAAKILALKPKLIENVESENELIGRVIGLSKELAKAIPSGPPHI
jgi:hypothetical protein